MSKPIRPALPRQTTTTTQAPTIDFQCVVGYDPDELGDFMDRIGPVPEPRDIANLVALTCEQPAHVHLNDIVIRPPRQEYP